MPPKGYTIKTTRPTADFLLGFPRSRFLLVAFGSGVLMGLTPAPVNAWFLAWIALAPLWVMIFRSSAPLLAALVWGIGYHGLALSWIRDLHPLTWMGVPWLASLAIAGFCWGFITLWGALLVVLWAWLLRRFTGIAVKQESEPTRSKQVTQNLQHLWLKTGTAFPIGLRILLAVALWCGLEALWGQGVLYWTSLSYTQSPHNLAILHLGQISGPLTVTAAIVAFNGILAEAWLQWRQQATSQVRQLLLLATALLLGLHLLGFVLYRQPLADSSGSALKVGIVQGNIPTRIKLFEQGLRLSLENYLKGYETLVDQGVDAVLTPEGALPWLWVNQPTDNPLYRSIVAKGVPAWIGTVGLRQGRITQTLFSINASGELVGRYDKVKLVPLGEYIPFESVLGGVVNRLSPVGASMLPGEFNQRLQTPFGQAIAGICYESAFPELFRRQAASGGAFILTASNNDPYGRAMMAQHHAQDVMRSIETNRWAVRATNTGLSGIVDPHGRTQWLSRFRTFEAHAHTIYRRQTQTLYVRWGNWLTPVLLGLSSVIWLGRTLQGKRTE
jgi:apolipoprotein N-acyltransferase